MEIDLADDWADVSVGTTSLDARGGQTPGVAPELPAPTGVRVDETEPPGSDPRDVLRAKMARNKALFAQDSSNTGVSDETVRAVALTVGVMLLVMLITIGAIVIYLKRGPTEPRARPKELAGGGLTSLSMVQPRAAEAPASPVPWYHHI